MFACVCVACAFQGHVKSKQYIWLWTRALYDFQATTPRTSDSIISSQVLPSRGDKKKKKSLSRQKLISCSNCGVTFTGKLNLTCRFGQKLQLELNFNYWGRVEQTQQVVFVLFFLNHKSRFMNPAVLPTSPPHSSPGSRSRPHINSFVCSRNTSQCFHLSFSAGSELDDPPMCRGYAANQKSLIKLPNWFPWEG